MYNIKVDIFHHFNGNTIVFDSFPTIDKLPSLLHTNYNNLKSVKKTSNYNLKINRNSKKSDTLPGRFWCNKEIEKDSQKQQQNKKNNKNNKKEEKKEEGEEEKKNKDEYFLIEISFKSSTSKNISNQNMNNNDTNEEIIYPSIPIGKSITNRRILIPKKNNCNNKKQEKKEKEEGRRGGGGEEEEEEEEEESIENKNIIVIPKYILCALTNKIYTGIYYTFLMTHSLSGKKTDTSVGYSTNPLYEIYLHNHQLVNDRTTNAAAPHWQPDAILGPFGCIGKAIACSNELVSKTRGKVSKRKKTFFLSRIFNVNLYTRIIKKDEPFLEYLSSIAPNCYIKKYKELIKND